MRHYLRNQWVAIEFKIPYNYSPCDLSPKLLLCMRMALDNLMQHSHMQILNIQHVNTLYYFDAFKATREHPCVPRGFWRP
jgi:hypothetical protein